MNKMISIEDALKIFSPLDVVIFEIEIQEIVDKNEVENYDVFPTLIKKIEEFINLGEYPTRNPTYWRISEGLDKNKVDDWDDLVRLEISNDPSFRVHWTDLDNNSLVATARAGVSLLMHNIRDLPASLIKEVKCATVYTAFGKMELDL